MRPEWLGRARLRHNYLAAGILLTVAAGVAAVWLDLGAQLSEWADISAGRAASLLLPMLIALALIGFDAIRERRSRIKHERNLIQTNLRLRQNAAAMERLARIDALTGLDNRRAWHEKLDVEWRRSQRYGRPPAVIMLDLDHFKTVNDRFGHEAGDQLLTLVAEVLRASLRASDAIGRLGGDEFAVLLPQATIEETIYVAEKMCSSVAEQVRKRFPHAAAVTASAGVASGAGRGVIDAQQLLRLADGALYGAKAAGRNQVLVADGSNSALSASA